MTEFIKYPSIESLKNAAYKIKATSDFHGQPAEIINFTGDVKIHGTNAAIVYNPHDESYHCQSRTRILGTGKQDNHGFCGWVDNELGLDGVRGILKNLLRFSPNLRDLYIAIYGEWCGGNIQKGVSISGMKKQFIIFDIQVISERSEVQHDEGVEVVWKRESLPSEYWGDLPEDTHWVGEFASYNVTVDFNDYTDALPELDKIKFEVEDSCPVGASLNPSNPNTVGEGAVFTGYNSKGEMIQFKHKGNKHKRTVRAPKTPWIEKLEPEQQEAVKGFVQEAISGRLDQGVEMMQLEGHPPLVNTTGKYINWVIGDVKKEMSLELKDLKTNQGLVEKDVLTQVSSAAKMHWMEYILKE